MDIFQKKKKIPYDTAFPLLGVCLKEKKSLFQIYEEGAPQTGIISGVWALCYIGFSCEGNVLEPICVTVLAGFVLRGCIMLQ